MEEAFLQKKAECQQMKKMRWEMGENIQMTIGLLDLVDTEASAIPALPRYEKPKNFSFGII